MARRLGGAGVSVRRLVDYVVAFDSALPWLPAPCIVCTRAVTGEHIARTTHAVHGDPKTRSGCWANYIEMRTT